MSDSIRFEGIDGLIDKVDELANPDKLLNAMGRACALVERAAKQNAPKGIGELRRSITSRIETEGGEIVGIVYTPLEYAPYVEYGTGLFAEDGGRKDVPWNYQDDEGEWHTTSGQHPIPYMRPALNDNIEKVKKILKEGITE